MQPNIPIAIAAGFVAALSLVAATRGPAGLGGLMVMLVGLPLAIAGLVSNAVTAFLSTAVTCLLLGVVVSPAVALAFALGVGLPVAGLVYLCLLHRDLGPKLTQWYPVGAMIAVAALVSAVLTALGLMLVSGGGGVEQLDARLGTALDGAIAAGLGGLSQTDPLNPEQRAKTIELMRELVPGTTSAFWMLSLLVSLWAAGRLALAAGKLVRPWPDLAAMKLPLGTPVLFAVALAAVLALDGMPRLVAMSFVGTLSLGYVLSGLAVIHFVSRGWSWRRPALRALYVVLIVFSSFAAFGLALLGLLDALLPLRQIPELGGPPPSSS